MSGAAVATDIFGADIKVTRFIYILIYLLKCFAGANDDNAVIEINDKAHTA